jgi:hypothetical protein
MANAILSGAAPAGIVDDAAKPKRQTPSVKNFMYFLPLFWPLQWPILSLGATTKRLPTWYIILRIGDKVGG